MPSAVNGGGHETRRLAIADPAAMTGEDSTQEFAVELDGIWLADEDDQAP